MNKFSVAIRDLLESITNPHLWRWTGVQDIRLRYRRSTLGPWWLTISTGIMVCSMGFLYAGIFKTEISEYVPHFAVGQVFWVFFSTQIIESTTAFTQFDSILKQVKFPLTSCVLRILTRSIIILAHNAVIIVIVFLIFGFNLSWANLLIIPGLIILLFSLFSISLIVAVWCTRFRDLAQIVTSVLQILFFLSPIFWKVDALGTGPRMLLAKLNPVYYLMEIVRQPIFGRPATLDIWLGAILIAITSFIFALFIFSKYRTRVTYWL